MLASSVKLKGKLEPSKNEESEPEEQSFYQEEDQ